ncbi:hypothetical protein GQ55_2G468600 [Panicum hallii var. hallii]|uniref:HIG1 domain-containing protein n=1 Tax=Panicum hallii var. hallii TaxID=1504633 RepID=A0A2T7EZV1_9POAL|nr:hypothetical protein GQ55_2G468600 [Panicum hallii var. hallii]
MPLRATALTNKIPPPPLPSSSTVAVQQRSPTRAQAVGFGTSARSVRKLSGEMAEEKNALQSAREWVVDHKLRAVGTLWLSGIVGSIAYNWSRPGMKTSVKIIHARLHAQALTLAALAGSALVEYYDHQQGSGSKVHQYAKQYLSSEGSSQKE